MNHVIDGLLEQATMDTITVLSICGVGSKKWGNIIKNKEAVAPAHGNMNNSNAALTLGMLQSKLGL